MGKSNASSNQKAGLGSFVLLLNQIPEEKSETVEWQITPTTEFRLCIQAYLVVHFMSEETK